MLRVKLFSVVAVAVVLIVAVLVATSPSRADDPGPAVTVEKREVPEGTITEITEVIDSPGAAPELTSSLVYTSVVEAPEGTITEITEVIDSPGAGRMTEITEVIDSPAAEPDMTSTLVYTNVIEVPEGIIVEQVEVINPSNVKPPEKQQPDSQIESVLTFSDALNATCSVGAEFKYSTTSGVSGYYIYWDGGSYNNAKDCSSSCNFTITTSWPAFYKYAEATVWLPTQVWGPYPDAFTCR